MSYSKYVVSFVETDELQAAINREYEKLDYGYLVVSVVALHRNPGQKQPYRIVWERRDEPV